MAPSLRSLQPLFKLDPRKALEALKERPRQVLDRIGDRLEIAGSMAKETFRAMVDNAPRLIDGAAHPRALPAALRRIQANMTEELSADLQRVAASAYEEKDPDKLRDTYALLAIGGALKGLPLASKLLVNHLTAGKEINLPWSTIEKGGLDAAVRADDKALQASVNEKLAAGAQLPLRFSLHQQHAIDPSKKDRDLYYGIGHFLLHSKSEVTVTRGADGKLKVDVARELYVEDPYDWNPNGTAGGTQAGVSGFDNDWGQYLVDTGRAKEFMVRASKRDQQSFVVDPPSARRSQPRWHPTA